MLTRRTLTALAVAVVLAAGAGGAYVFTRASADEQVSQMLAADNPPAATVEPLPDIVLGDPNAPVTVIEYASMTCPHCARFNQTTFQQLKKDYIDTGKVKFVMREFPLDAWAAAVAMLARCNSNNFYPIVDLFFETQAEWAVAENTLGKIEGIARQAGISRDAMRTCLSDQKLLDGINAVKDHGFREMGVDATPTLYVDGEKVEGDRSIKALKDMIDPKLRS